MWVGLYFYLVFMNVCPYVFDRAVFLLDSFIAFVVFFFSFCSWFSFFLFLFWCSYWNYYFSSCWTWNRFSFLNIRAADMGQKMWCHGFVSVRICFGVFWLSWQKYIPIFYVNVYGAIIFAIILNWSDPSASLLSVLFIVTLLVKCNKPDKWVDTEHYMVQRGTAGTKKHTQIYKNCVSIVSTHYHEREIIQIYKKWIH